MFLTICVFERDLSVLGCFSTFEEAQDCMIDDMVDTEGVSKKEITSHDYDGEDFEFNDDSGWSNNGGNNIDWTIIDVNEERNKTLSLSRDNVRILFHL